MPGADGSSGEKDSKVPTGCFNTFSVRLSLGKGREAPDEAPMASIRHADEAERTPFGDGVAGMRGMKDMDPI